MDAFSEILSGVKLNGALYFSAEFSAPWGFSSPPANKLAALLALGAPHLVIYHFRPVLKVNIRTDRCRRWRENSILHLVEEAASGRVGSAAMLAKLSEALFVEGVSPA